MSWLQYQRIKHFLTTSLWIVPVTSMLAAMIMAPLTRLLNDLAPGPYLEFGLQGARAAIGLIVAAMLTFVVFFFSVLMVTVQIASATLSPRVVARPFRSNVLRLSVGLFVFTFVYGTSVLGRLEDRVLQLPVCLTVLMSLLSIGIFLYVVEHIATELRPSTVVAAVAREGHSAIQKVYPSPWTGGTAIKPAGVLLKQSTGRVIMHPGRSGVFIAFNLNGLVSLAQMHDCLIEMIPQVGDFIGPGIPLFRVHCGGNHLPDRLLYKCIVLGPERMMEQDPAFALRVIVDIAEKALSPAVTDPTTGTQAIDQIQLLLTEIGKRDLNTGVVRDGCGKVRLVLRKPDWEEYVLLTIAEIRPYAKRSMQITRRLRAMIAELIMTLPPERAPLLQEQLKLLDATIEREFADFSRHAQAETKERGERLLQVSVD